MNPVMVRGLTILPLALSTFFGAVGSPRAATGFENYNFGNADYMPIVNTGASSYITKAYILVINPSFFSFSASIYHYGQGILDAVPIACSYTGVTRLYPGYRGIGLTIPSTKLADGFNCICVQVRNYYGNPYSDPTNGSSATLTMGFEFIKPSVITIAKDGVYERGQIYAATRYISSAAHCFEYKVTAKGLSNTFVPTAPFFYLSNFHFYSTFGDGQASTQVIKPLEAKSIAFRIRGAQDVIKIGTKGSDSSGPYNDIPLVNGGSGTDSYLNLKNKYKMTDNGREMYEVSEDVNEPYTLTSQFAFPPKAGARSRTYRCSIIFNSAGISGIDTYIYNFSYIQNKNFFGSCDNSDYCVAEE